jgi:putative hydrolase
VDPDLPPGLGGFLQGFLGDLLRLMRTDSPVQWDLAGQLAQTIAAENTSEPNVDPVERIRLEELARLAEMHVSDVTGIALASSASGLSVLPTGRADWARRSLADWRPLIEQIASSIAPPTPPGAPGGPPGTPTPGTPGTSGEGGTTGEGGGNGGSAGAGDEPGSGGGPADLTGASGTGFPGLFPGAGGLPDLGGGEGGEGVDFAALIGQWTTAIAPAMIAMQVGSIVGHLARRALGQYELPLPRANDSELLVVPANVASFASDWSLPADDVRLFLLVRDLAAHALLTRPHVRARVEALLVEHARGIRPDPSVLDARLGELGGDLSDLTRLLGDPTALGQTLDTPEARRVRAALSAVEAAIAGYVEWVTDTVAARSVGARAPVAEAMRRRRVERSAEERSAEALFGLRLDQDQVDRGIAFVRGVIERAGTAELDKLWLIEGGLPTPAELDAPGLWIERVNLPSLPPEGS